MHQPMDGASTFTSMLSKMEEKLITVVISRSELYKPTFYSSSLTWYTVNMSTGTYSFFFDKTDYKATLIPALSSYDEKQILLK